MSPRPATDWNFADTWESVAAANPDAEALVGADRSVSWARFDARCEAVAAALLEAGLGQQAKVAQYLFNCPEYLESVFAAFKVAMVPVNTNYRYTPDEIASLWADADIEAVVYDVEFIDNIEALRGRLPGIRLWLEVGGDVMGRPWATSYESVVDAPRADPAVRVRAPWGRSGDDLMLVYTGGTTGMPKGVMWRQDDLWSILNRTGNLRYPEDGDQSDVARILAAPAPHQPPRLLPGPPLMHGTGLFTALSVLSSGGTVVLNAPRQFSAAGLLDTVEREGVTQMSIVGDAFARPLLAELDTHPRRWDLSRLWLIISSGVMWSSGVKEGLLKHQPKLLLVDQLGSSEAVGLGGSRSSAKSPAATADFRLGPDARVITEDGTDVTPGSGVAGLLALRGRGPIGYYKDPVKTDATFRLINGERWAVPGDYATVGRDGVVTLLGRGSGCINTGGEKVFPEEVEEIIKTAPGVVDAVVIGVPDERFGEVVIALVEYKGVKELDRNELISHVKEHLAGYKAPRRVFELDTIGRAPNGKVDYRRLRRLAVELSS